MGNLIDMRIKVEWHRDAVTKLRDAYLALVDGGVQAYSIGSRSLTKFDLPKIREEIREHEKAIEQLEEEIRGGKRRKAVGVVPRDW